MANSGIYDDRELKQFDRWGVPRPTFEPHGTPEDIRANLKPPKVKRWYLDGNKLIAETDIGNVVNHIPPNYILRGIDENNLPILEKLVL